MTEIESVAAAIALHDGTDWWGAIGGRECVRKRYRNQASAAIEALDNFRNAEKRKNCKHLNRTGTGSIGSDGSGWSTWFCQECGASYDSRESTVVPRPLRGAQ